MGAYLSSPVTDKKSDDFNSSEKFVCGLSGMQGWRISMEVSVELSCYSIDEVL